MSKNNSAQDLREELASLADTLEEVLSQGGDRASNELSRVHKKARETLKGSRQRLGDSSERIAQSTRDAAKKADSYIQDKPWHGVGVGAALGLLVGILISRR